MTIETKDTVYVCVDCLQWLANADPSSLDYHYDETTAAERLEEIKAGERSLVESIPGGSIVAGNGENDDDFSRSPCGCCGSRLHGSRHEFHILADNGLSAWLQHGEPGGPYSTEPVPVVESILPWQEKGLSYTASGYGRKIPTAYKVRWFGRWYRVYCAIFSNVGRLYIVSRGEEIRVDIERNGEG